ncbi:MAG: DUF1501 domain-containing protein [Verrucomicrobiota bacterium]
MKKSLRQEEQSRRQFMSRSAASAAGLTGVVSTITNMRLMQAALASSAEEITDYKALIVLFLFGGVNTDNMLMPGASHPGRANYDNYRGVLAIPTGNQLPITAGNLSGGEESFGLHPTMPDVQNIFNNTGGAGNLSFVANVGTLIEPTIKTGDLQFNVPVPPQLFSHSDQQVQWQSSVPDQPFTSGWAGRVADILSDMNNMSNPNSKISMSVTLSGLNSLLVSVPGAPIQYSVTTDGAISLNGYGANYVNALDDPSNIYSYKNPPTSTSRRLEAFQKIMDYSHANLMEDSYNTVVKRARVNEGFVGNALDPTILTNLGLDFDNIFTTQHGVGSIDNLPSVSQQLLTIAKMIAGRDCLGNRRQLFFCSQGGYDTHQDQGGFDGTNLVAGDLDDNLTDLNNALASFNECMQALGGADPNFNYDDFLLATHSDFNRTFTPNGNVAGSSGSDHGWGGHHIVMGGGVKGGNVYGYYHDLQVTGQFDVNNIAGSRGRWIPTTSVDQFSAPLASWLGIDTGAGGSIPGSEMATIFPNLERFANPFQSTYDPSDPLANANLDYLL